MKKDFKTDKLKVQLEGNDTAIILKEDGTFQLCVPDLDEDDIMPENIILAHSICVNLEQNPSFANNAIRFFEEKSGLSILNEEETVNNENNSYISNAHGEDGVTWN
jgi:hypothetical protein